MPAACSVSAGGREVAVPVRSHPPACLRAAASSEFHFHVQPSGRHCRGNQRGNRGTIVVNIVLLFTDVNCIEYFRTNTSAGLASYVGIFCLQTSHVEDTRSSLLRLPL